MKQHVSISDFSKHLFWDIDSTKLDFEKNRKYIINRVLQYGLINDWNNIQKIYGIEKIAKTAVTIRDLDKKSASFIATISNTLKKDFICYTYRQSTPKHWHF